MSTLIVNRVRKWARVNGNSREKIGANLNDRPFSGRSDAVMKEDKTNGLLLSLQMTENVTNL